MRDKTENKKTKKTIFGLARRINNTKTEGTQLPLQETDKKCVWADKDNGKPKGNLSGILKKYDYDVVTAENEKEVWDSFKQKPTAFFITEIILPEMTTLDLLRVVKGTDPQTEVIIVTGYDAVESYLELINL
jgi:DNA-binding NtrC family response regulator